MHDEQMEKALFEKFGQLRDKIEQVKATLNNPGWEDLVDELVAQGVIPKDEIIGYLSKHLGIPYVDLQEYDLDHDTVCKISREVAQKHACVCIGSIPTSVVIAIADPNNIFAIDDIKFLTDRNVDVVLALKSDILKAIDLYYENRLSEINEWKRQARIKKLN